LIVEIEHQLGIAVPTLDAGHVFNSVFFPQPARISKGFDAAFGTNAGASEDNKVFGHGLI